MLFRLAESIPNLPMRQILRYSIVGLLTNSTGYALYLLLTYAGGTPKLTITMLYAVGALIGFFANRHYTFHHDGRIGVAGIRFAFVHLSGYLLNCLLLATFVDCLGFAHQLVQAISIFIVALYLFVVFRIFVFKPHSKPSEVTL